MRRWREVGLVQAGFRGMICALVAASAPQAVGEPSSVWKVKGERSCVYLAGTVHVLRPGDQPIPGVFEKAYQRSRRVFFEIDLKELESPDGRSKLRGIGLLPEGVRLQDRIQKPLHAKLSAYLEGVGASGDALDRFTPAMAALAVTQTELTRLGARPELGVEMFFDRRARADRRPVVALESADFQMRLFDKLSLAEQEEFLRLTLESAGDIEKDFSDLIRAWRGGDARGLGEVVKRHFEGHESLEKVMLSDRNRAWLGVVEGALKSDSGDSLFLVGIGHLAGQEGLIRLLEEKGYAVEQLKGE